MSIRDDISDTDRLGQYTPKTEQISPELPHVILKISQPFPGTIQVTEDSHDHLRPEQTRRWCLKTAAMIGVPAVITARSGSWLVISRAAHGPGTINACSQ